MPWTTAILSGCTYALRRRNATGVSSVRKGSRSFETRGTGFDMPGIVGSIALRDAAAAHAVRLRRRVVAGARLRPQDAPGAAGGEEPVRLAAEDPEELRLEA